MEIKKCLWCLNEEPNVSFNSRAHIFPQSLGAKKIFPFECDECNNYFGNYNNQKPSIDLVLKEAFNLSRYMLLSYGGNVPPKFKSNFFKANYKKRSWSIQPQFKFRKNFQKELGLQLNKGLIKIALETLYLKNEIGYQPEFNSFRNFVRQDLEEKKVYYLRNNVGVVLTSEKFLRNPEVLLSDNWALIFNKYGCFEFEILSHRFVIPFKENISNDYFINERERNRNLFSSPIELNYFTDIDFTLSIFKD